MTIQSEPFVSVLTPVYNTEKYLGECIESVIKQTYKNWEYVILDNKSTDRTLEISESYAKKDKRIRVISNVKHLKQMENLNQAFYYISINSKYCKVIHADDWLFPECLSKMVEVAEAYPSIGIVGSYRLDERNVNLDGLPFPSPCSNGKMIGRGYFLDKGYLFGSPSSLLIRSNLIRERKKFYDETTLYGDTTACLNILRKNDFGFVHQVLTFTRRHNESATTYSRRYETYRLGKLQALTSYGKCFLSNREYNKYLKTKYTEYYKFLAKMLLELRGRDFINFHKTELSNLGHLLSYSKLLIFLCWELLNFREACKALINGIKRKDTRNPTNPNEEIIR